jgi:hypothetical protein
MAQETGRNVTAKIMKDNPLALMRAELKKLNALARRYRAALEEIELNPHVDAVAIAKETLKQSIENKGQTHE